MISLTTRALLPFYKVEDVTLFCEIFATADDNFKGDLDIDAWYVWGTILYGWAWAVRERPGGGVRHGVCLHRTRGACVRALPGPESPCGGRRRPQRTRANARRR